MRSKLDQSGETARIQAEQIRALQEQSNRLNWELTQKNAVIAASDDLALLEEERQERKVRSERLLGSTHRGRHIRRTPIRCQHQHQIFTRPTVGSVPVLVCPPGRLFRMRRRWPRRCSVSVWRLRGALTGLSLS